MKTWKNFIDSVQKKVNAMSKEMDNLENTEQEQVAEESKKPKKETNRKKTDKTKEELEKTQAELAELKDKYLRLLAEFDNYKRRTVKEKLDLMKTASQDVVEAILPVLDDFDRAKKMATGENANEVFPEGIALVYDKFYSILKSKGLEPMDSTGLVFDPETHEAITEIPAPTEELKGKVVDTIEKGYKLQDKIIRYAKVIVGK
jgi:molecular chaperone GrpE